MSNLVKWAEAELNRIEKDSDGMQEVMNKGVLDVIKVFSNQGHSGLSSSYALSTISRLLSWKPLTPLTGEDDEWHDVENDFYQNSRCSAVFRIGTDNSTAYYIDGKSFSDDGGESWFTNGDSHVPVTFPYTVPETEYIILDEVMEDKSSNIAADILNGTEETTNG